MKRETLAALAVFGQSGTGFILCDGANIPPGSPVENISALWHASREFAATRNGTGPRRQGA